MRRGVADTNCHGNGNCRSKRYAYRDGNSDTYTNGYSYCYVYPNTHAYAKGYADAQTSADSAPSRVEWATPSAVAPPLRHRVKADSSDLYKGNSRDNLASSRLRAGQYGRIGSRPGMYLAPRPSVQP